MDVKTRCESLIEADVVIAQLEEALASRTVTARATGLLAARYAMSTDQAWWLLRETSMMSNQKLVGIAQVIVGIHDERALSLHEQEVAVALAVVLDPAVMKARVRYGPRPVVLPG